METIDRKAIDINFLNGNPFPISIDFSTNDNLYRIFLTPISVLEILDLIPLNTFLVFNVDSNEFYGLKPITLTELVNKYSSYPKKFDEETLLMEKKNVVTLLGEISHYNFCLLDAEREIEIDEVIHIIDIADKWNDLIVIKEVKKNSF